MKEYEEVYKNLKKVGDGIYEGSYKGLTFTVKKEPRTDTITTNTEMLWTARVAKFVGRAQGNDNTRKEAIRSLCRALDMTAVDASPLHDILQPFLDRIEVLLPQLKGNEKNRHKLLAIKMNLEFLETTFRLSISNIENDITKLEKEQLAEEGPRISSPKKLLT